MLMKWTLREAELPQVDQLQPVRDDPEAEHELGAKQNVERHGVEHDRWSGRLGAREESRMRREALLEDLQTGHGEAQQVLAAPVDQEKRDGQEADEDADQQENGGMGFLVQRGKNAAVGEDGKNDEKIKRLQALIGVELEVLPEVLLLRVGIVHAGFHRTGLLDAEKVASPRRTAANPP